MHLSPSLSRFGSERIAEEEEEEEIARNGRVVIDREESATCVELYRVAFDFVSWRNASTALRFLSKSGIIIKKKVRRENIIQDL